MKMEMRIAFSSHQEPLRNAPGKSPHPTPLWRTAKSTVLETCKYCDADCDLHFAACLLAWCMGPPS